MYPAFSTADITEVEIYRFNVLLYAIVWAVVIFIVLTYLHSINMAVHIRSLVTGERLDVPSVPATAKTEERPQVESRVGKSTTKKKRQAFKRGGRNSQTSSGSTMKSHRYRSPRSNARRLFKMTDEQRSFSSSITLHSQISDGKNLGSTKNVKPRLHGCNHTSFENN